MNVISFFSTVLLLVFVIDDVASQVNDQHGKKVVSRNFNISDSCSENGVKKEAKFIPGRNSSDNIPCEEFNETLRRASLLEKDVVFQDLNPFHRELARPLFQILMRIDKTALNSALDIAKTYVNKHLHIHIRRSVMAHRTDTVGTIIPSHVTLDPHAYFDLSLLSLKKISEHKTLYLSGKFHNDPKSRDEEYRLSYFRLDPGLNTHHERWHIAHLDSRGYKGDWRVDRSGEMFYYMHSQMVRRYNFERVCANVPFVLPLLNFRDPIPEPYFENLQHISRERFWDSRPPNQIMTDIDVRGLAMNVQELEVWRTRLYDAIDRRHVYRRQGDDDMETLELLNGPKKTCEPTPGIPFDVGIDKLGNMVWANDRSVNRNYYGNLHNQGHTLLGNIHDPQGKYHRQSRAMAMAATSTAARDPVFYRWHKFIDDVFERYKATLPPYTEKELEFKNIFISNVQIKSCGETANIIRTRWVTDRVDITEGVSDSLKEEILQVNKVYYDFVHLDHEDFEYHINISSKHQKEVKGIVRIFMAPVYDDWKFEEELTTFNPKYADEQRKINKKSEPYFNKYRKLFIELDKFVVNIPAKPYITWVIRSSRSSSVTVPFKNLFMTSEEARQATNDSKKGNEFLAWNGCGWPNYLLVGRGNETGFPVQLFVMISDYEKDKVSDVTDNVNDSETDKSFEPHGSLSHCGVPDKKYPDRKPMGFPFDRNVEFVPSYLHHFMSRTRRAKDTPDDIKPEEKYENMKVIDIKIQHFPGNPVNGSTIDCEYDACKLWP